MEESPKTSRFPLLVFGFLGLIVAVGVLLLIRENHRALPRKHMGHNLAALGNYRDMLLRYRNENGEFPNSIALLFPKYGNQPFAPDLAYPTGWFSYATHPMGTQIRTVSALTPDDSGGWLYNNNPASPDYGKFAINCVHSSYQGPPYSEL